MRRRHFVQNSALAGGLFLWSPHEILLSRAKHIGVQLYSVRDVAEKNITSTLGQLAQMGYKEVEGYLYENGRFHTFAPKGFRELLHQLELRMVSMHHGIDMKYWDAANKTLNDAAKKTIDDHAEVGVQQLICPSVDTEFKSVQPLKRLCEVFNHFGEACKKAGIQFGYHNHDYEFRKAEDLYLMDVLLQQTDPALVKWEMDLYWVSYAQEDPAHWVNQYPGRVSAFHVKDLAPTPQRETAVVGDGVIDFKTIFNQKGASGVKYYIVELEHYKTTSLDGVRNSLTNLRTLLG